MFTVTVSTKDEPKVGEVTQTNIGWSTRLDIEAPTILTAVERSINIVGQVESLAVGTGEYAYSSHLPEVWGLGQAAEYLGVTREAVRLMVTEGRLPATRADSSWVVLATDVRARKKG